MRFLCSRGTKRPRVTVEEGTKEPDVHQHVESLVPHKKEEEEEEEIHLSYLQCLALAKFLEAVCLEDVAYPVGFSRWAS